MESVPQRGSVWLKTANLVVVETSHTLPRCGTDSMTLRLRSVTPSRTPPQIPNAKRPRLRQAISNLFRGEPSRWDQIIRNWHNRRRWFNHAFRQNPNLRKGSEWNFHRPVSYTHLTLPTSDLV